MPENLAQVLQTFGDAIKSVPVEDFESGFFVMMQNVPGDEGEESTSKVMATALGPPPQLAMLLTTSLLDLANREPAFKPTILAVILGMARELILGNDGAYAFFETQLREIKTERDSRSKTASTTVSEALERISKNLH